MLCISGRGPLLFPVSASSDTHRPDSPAIGAHIARTASPPLLRPPRSPDGPVLFPLEVPVMSIRRARNATITLAAVVVLVGAGSGAALAEPQPYDEDTCV